MAETIDGLALRKRLGRENWMVPKPFGEDGFIVEHKFERKRVIVTASPAPEPEFDGDWIHASVSRTGENPTYADMAELHRAVWPDGWAYQMFAPPASHVNIHEHALHLWGRADGAPVLPNFGLYGTI